MCAAVPFTRFVAVLEHVATAEPRLVATPSKRVSQESQKDYSDSDTIDRAAPCYDSWAPSAVLLAVAFSAISLAMSPRVFPSVTIPSFLAVEIRLSSGVDAGGVVDVTSLEKVVNSFYALSNSLRAWPMDLASSGILFGPQRKRTASTSTTTIISHPVTANPIPPATPWSCIS